MAKVKFQKHAVVTPCKKRVRVFYSANEQAVTVYARDYDSRVLEEYFPAEYKNDTDVMTDYFDKGRLRFPADHPMYAEMKALVEGFEAAKAAKYEAARIAV